MSNIYAGNYLKIGIDQRTVPYNLSLQGTGTGNFINLSINADGNFGLNINGSLSAIPQLAQVSAIISGILAVFGLSQTEAEPPAQFKTVTLDPGVTLGTLFGAAVGVNFLVQVLKGKIEQIKNYINSAVTSIENLFECLTKNPLIAAAIIAKMIRKGWIVMPEPVKVALEKIRDAINKTIGLNIIINNPLAEYLRKLREFLQYKFPPPILLPFIPFIPGCTPAFYSGRPPLVFLNKQPIVAEVEPRVITTPGGFTSKINVEVPVIPVDFGPGESPNLELSDQQVENLLGSYNPYDLYTSGIIPTELNENLINSNYPIQPAATNSAVRQVQDRLISAGNSLSSTVTALNNKDVSRVGYIPRSSPLDDLLCNSKI